MRTWAWAHAMKNWSRHLLIHALPAQPTLSCTPGMQWTATAAARRGATWPGQAGASKTVIFRWPNLVLFKIT
ncbi:hypothetical protein AAFF_G00416400 [Aldrovandia affinis]|uniref:Secreted protein n=1 Tax=Aldrovandia affinis TaxID=143900 RepID=A0AAD7SAV5_9TELE|nr:hypothetical protein AAFF_G00416400 [Aldrovandia affinis]